MSGETQGKVQSEVQNEEQSEVQSKAQNEEQSEVQLETSWKSRLLPEFEKPYMKELKAFLQEELRQKKRIYPPGPKYFNAFNTTPFSDVRAVIVGQDPYHGFRQAHGLSFSVPVGVAVPPSLLNIYRELKSDLNIPMADHGCLKAWAEQGVLLLNSSLTVEAGKAGSHRGRGWEEFTDKIISLLNEEKDQLVFFLWGSPAQRKGSIVDSQRHCVLKAPHPSPLSATRGFFGCRHFSKANEYLESKNLKPIDWSLHLQETS